MWKIIDNMGQEQSITVMMAEHPELIGYDESGFEVEPMDLLLYPDEIADGGYFGASERRILFFQHEHEADDGLSAIAKAIRDDDFISTP